MTLTTISNPLGIERGIRRLLERLGERELSACVQSAAGATAARTGWPELADCIDDGRVSAKSGGDDELAALLKSVLEELDAAVRTGRGSALVV